MSLQCCTTDSNIKLFLHSKEGHLSEDLERLFWLLVGFVFLFVDRYLHHKHKTEQLVHCRVP